jgi:hypothetical protein
MISQFLSALEESFDMLGTDPAVYNNFVKNKSKISNSIVLAYQAAGDISDPFYPEVKESVIRQTIQNILSPYLSNIAIQQNYKLRTSGTAFGRGVRNKFADKYEYTVSFKTAVASCVENNKKMLIIDDNINSGTDFRKIDKKIQEIFMNSGISPARKLDITRNIKMFVLYKMSAAKGEFLMKLGNKNITTLSTDPKIVIDFKNKILGYNTKLPDKVKMSFIIDNKKQNPNKSLPTLELKIDSTGAISSISTDITKTSQAYASKYSQYANPSTWNFPFTVGDVIVGPTGDFIPKFEIWAKSIGIFVNGEKFK